MTSNNPSCLQDIANYTLQQGT